MFMFEDILDPQLNEDEDEWIEIDLTIDEFEDLTNLPDFGDIGC